MKKVIFAEKHVFRLGILWRIILKQTDRVKQIIVKSIWEKCFSEGFQISNEVYEIDVWDNNIWDNIWDRAQFGCKYNPALPKSLS